MLGQQYLRVFLLARPVSGMLVELCYRRHWACPLKKLK
jgi:hypothetical protein